MDHECTMKDEIDIKFDKIQTNVKWVLSICAGMIVLLLIGMTTQSVVQKALREKVNTINKDYAPLEVIQDIMENSARTNKILIAIPQMTKDDPRYLQMVEDKEKFQQEALQRLGNAKRGGSSNTGEGVQ